MRMWVDNWEQCCKFYGIKDIPYASHHFNEISQQNGMNYPIPIYFQQALELTFMGIFWIIFFEYWIIILITKIKWLLLSLTSISIR